MSISKRVLRRVIAPLIIIVLIAGYVAYAFAQPINTLTPTLHTPAGVASQTVHLPWPSYGEGALGAVGYGVLTTNGDQTPLPTASTIKVLTTLAVLKVHPLNPGESGPAITITQTDVDSYNKYVAEDGSVVRVQVGEQITEYQAIQALLLPSANNMAETLARWAYGSIDAYNTAANQLAASLGMASTTVTDPSGFLPTTVASAHDLTLLAEAAIQNPVIAQIARQQYATIPVQGVVYNYNAVLGQNGVIGLKTGNNDQDKGVFVFAATHTVGDKSVTLVGAIMGAPALHAAMNDCLPVIAAADNNFVTATIVHKGDVVGTYQVAWSKPVDAIASQDVSVLNWKGKGVMVTVDLSKLHAPVTTSKTVGSIAIQNSLDNSTQNTPVVLSHPIDKPSWLWRLTHAF